MEKYFFKTNKRKELLYKVLKSWEGTPYKHKTGIKNKGVDCIHFVACVMVECGVIQTYKMPDYPSDWHLHKGNELLRDEINKFECTVEYDPRKENTIDGDVLLFRYGRASSHSTIYFNGYVWQAVGDDEVRKNSIKLLKNRLTIGFRILEL